MMSLFARFARRVPRALASALAVAVAFAAAAGGIDGRETVVVGAGVEMVIDGAVDISSRTILHAAESNLFRIERGGTLVLRNLTITGKNIEPADGRLAAIFNRGALICSNVLFTALSSPNGAGAAYQDRAGARARFFGCSFIGNSAADGGAIFVESGDVTCVNCTFADNHATNGDGVRGGSAAAAIDGAQLRFADCTVTANETSSTNGTALLYYRASGYLGNSIVADNGPEGYELVSETEVPDGMRPFVDGDDFELVKDHLCLGDAISTIRQGVTEEECPVSSSVVYLGSSRDYTHVGVKHTWYPPVGAAKRMGVELYADVDYSVVSSDSAGLPVIIDTDIFDCPAAIAYMGARRYNALQNMIDATPPGGVCTVPADIYDTAIVGADKTGIVILGAGSASCVVNGENADICLTVLATNVFIGGFNFRNGRGDSGGGVKSSSALATVVSNCTFYADSADVSGGGVVGVVGLYDSSFTQCEATQSGGGAADVEDVRGCSFANCVAGGCGGGLSGALAVADTMFENCRATNDVSVGGGAYGGVTPLGVYTSCTFTECSANDGGGLANVQEANKCSFQKNTANSHGGGVYGVGTVADGSFLRNIANNGGGAALCTRIEDSVFDTNAAEENGGGTYNCDAVKYCTYISNVALDNGGGAYGAGSLEGCMLRGNSSASGGGASGLTQVIGTVFSKNAATNAGGAGSGDTVYRNCTFYYNSANSVSVEPESALSGGSCTDSLFSNNALPAQGCDSASKTLASSYFYDASNGDFHLHPGKNQTAYIGSGSGRNLAQNNHWTDPDKNDLVTQYEGILHYYLGAYAFSSVKLGGMVVTGPDDNYANSNLRTSLREAVEYAISSAANRSADGKYQITFSDKLFDSTGVATINFGQSGIVVGDYTNGALVVRGPADKTLIINGNDRYRPFTVNSGNVLELENVTFENCFGAPYALTGNPPPADGGCVLNRGMLRATNCAFRNSQAGHRIVNGQAMPGDPVGNGGALYNASGSTAVVVRCSFAGCRAVRGGAVYDESGSRTAYANSTFSGNTAIGSAGVEMPSGGAIYMAGSAPDSILVNCTVVGNSCSGGQGWGSGGGVSLEGSQGASTCRLVNSIVVGNSAATGPDIMSVGRMDLHYTSYGLRNDGADARWNDRLSEGGMSVADFFADLTADGGVGVRETVLGQGTVHSYLPLVTNCTAAASIVRANADYSLVATTTGTTARDEVTLVRGSSSIQARKAPIDRVDQLGSEARTDAESVHIGSVFATDERTTPPIDPPPHVDDPLAVTVAPPSALRSAIAYAAGNVASLAEEGRITVYAAEDALGAIFDFEEGDCNIPITSFHDATLVIRGPMTIDLHGLGRFLDVFGGNQVELYDITIVNGAAGPGQGGGAICVDSGEDGNLASRLYCSNCTFSACTAGSESDWGYGGAVSQEGLASSMLFENCVFSGNSSCLGLGDSIYHDGELGVRGCTLPVTDIYPLPLYAVVKGGDGTMHYFEDVADALAAIEPNAGDILVRLSEDCESEGSIPVPAGTVVVTVPADEMIASSMTITTVDAAPEPESDGAVLKMKNGIAVAYSVAAEAMDSVASLYGPGDSLTLGSDAESLLGAAQAIAAAAIKDRDWFDVTTDGLTVSTELNDLAIPVIVSIVVVEESKTSGRVEITPTNVKPDLWYGIGSSETLDGEFIAIEDCWMRADSSGQLAKPLEAPRVGNCRFYRVFAKP